MTSEPSSTVAYVCIQHMRETLPGRTGGKDRESTIACVCVACDAVFLCAGTSGRVEGDRGPDRYLPGCQTFYTSRRRISSSRQRFPTCQFLPRLRSRRERYLLPISVFLFPSSIFLLLTSYFLLPIFLVSIWYSLWYTIGIRNGIALVYHWYI